jgi:uncharacterized OsmC-like protein
MNTQVAIETKPTTLNGLNVDVAMATIQAIQDDPEIAQFQFRAKNQWIDGGENRTTIKGFYGAKTEDTSRAEAWDFTNGEPPVLLGQNEGANPVEFLLHALAGCVTTTFVLHAMARGIAIHSLSTELEGDIDLHGLLGMNDDVPAGYRDIRVKMHVEADCSDEALDDLLSFAQAHSPVYNTICRSVPVAVERAI